jgi:hypothetical protein
MALYRKLFVLSFSYVMLATSAAVASLDTNIFEMETKLLESIQTKTNEKMQPCEKIDFEEDLAYRDCLAEAAMYPLSAREKNDGITRVFDTVFNKIDESMQAGAAMKIAQDAIDGFKNKENDVKDRATYYEILKNLMDRLPQSKEEFRSVFTLIKDANMEIPEDVENERRHRMGLQTAALTEKAELVLSQKLSKASTEVSE